MNCCIRTSGICSNTSRSVTRNAIEAGEQVPYTRLVAETIVDAGFQITGLMWRRLEPSGFQRFKMKANPAYPLVCREDAIVARRT